MEIVDIAFLKDIVIPSENRYVQPHAEAMKLRQFWNLEKPPNISKEIQDARNLHKEASMLFQNGSPSKDILYVIKKGLKLDPKHHALFALKGDIYEQEGKWTEAIKNYENARTMVRFDRKILPKEARERYSKKLIKVYWKRGNSHKEANRLIEALADFEQVLVLKPIGTLTIEVEDSLLSTLKTLNKYEAYHANWLDFMQNVSPERASGLLTQFASYKIERTEMTAARRILNEAIDLDNGNDKAQELLQVVFDTGHSMVAYAVIWCIHGCYDKALMTIDKGTECDPYNPGYALLKAIVLRLSGRLAEAKKWLEHPDKGFSKLMTITTDKRGSITGNLTLEETQSQLMLQLYLIRYDSAYQCMLQGKYEEAFNLLTNENLTEKNCETHLLRGDCLVKMRRPNLALELYLECQRKSVESGIWENSCQRISLVRRLAILLNASGLQAAQHCRSKSVLRSSNLLIKAFEDLQVPLTYLGAQRAEALMLRARAHAQLSRGAPDCQAFWALADSLTFARGTEEAGSYGKVFGRDARLESVIDAFATAKSLPYCTKILMQMT